MAQDKIILYTNHRCPWAHRAHIALEELKVPFEEVIIDLDTPRTPEYLKINPRGLVPALSFNGEIITESAVVAQFLADIYPSHLVPVSNAPGGALRRARIAFFADTYASKVHDTLIRLYSATTDADREAISLRAVAALVNEIEPLLADASPFFGGSDKLTLAEVLTGSLAIRLITFVKVGVFPGSLYASLPEKAPNFVNWLENVSVHPSVTSIYDEEKVIASAKARIARFRAARS
ncbi:Glutathione-S-transferas-like protein omega 1 [Madurella fahalii]|uniref:Glutathione-S-transferas-like protein omega 1 n=1 Tax=Madurella fahalii TaxID=1157608 RepID=A0ABQ0G3V5_9PEZI